MPEAASNLFIRRHDMLISDGPEFAILRAICLGANSGSSEFATQTMDWSLLRRLSTRHRVDGLMWQQFATQGTTHRTTQPPVLIRAAFEQSSKELAFAALRQIRETLQLTALLEKCGYPVITLKGCALGQELYDGRPELRHANDIDLLVAPEDFAAVEGVLSAQGYERTTPSGAMPPSADSMARYLSHAYTYTHPAKNLYIELHHRPLSDPDCFAVPFADLLGRSRWVTIGNSRVRCLGREDLFVFLCAHAAGHAFFRL
ncbi:MAG: nucleotidyltransferase family protein, partial [Hyphomicrobium sp.]